MMQLLLRPLPPPAPAAPPRDAGQVVLVVRDLVVTTLIGIYDYEHVKPQRLRLNLELAMAPSDTAPWTYADLVTTARRIVTEGHTNLLECLAERLATALLSPNRALTALIRLEKLDAFEECEAVGVEIVRSA
ncbi:dihydroneopterin aldolase [Niveispirillum sp.]|uniref:dihydroneopterin aldolase n=1 Tax=Niveispirillum sp. TaxID=1917217 RepID=UPI001B5FB985|nr:dihydroneopterin aldolase [Niveispirillum sp.]MBP7336225.1 dihydroneopterin aldolase [Niveispirillum sp.]